MGKRLCQIAVFVAFAVYLTAFGYAAVSGSYRAPPSAQSSASDTNGHEGCAANSAASLKSCKTVTASNHSGDTDQHPQTESNKWADPNTYLTIMLVVVGFLQVWVLLRQAGSMATQASTMDTQAKLMDSTLAAAAKAAEDQSRDMQASIGAAQKAADAADLSAKAASRQVDTMIRLEMPIVFIDKIDFEIGGTSAVYSQIMLGEIPEALTIKLVFKNAGRHIARVIEIALFNGLAKSLSDTPIIPADRVYSVPTGTVIKSDATFEWRPPLPVHIMENDRLKIAGGILNFWIFGYISYRDFLERRHDIGFVARWGKLDAHQFGFVDDGPASYRYHHVHAEDETGET